MKIIIQTEYNNIDEKWLKSYLARLEQLGIPDLVLTPKVLSESPSENKSYIFTTNDPTDPKVIATTIYRFERKPPPYYHVKDWTT